MSTFAPGAELDVPPDPPDELHALSATTVAAAKEAGDKLSALGNVIKSQVTGAVAGLAPEIAQLAQEITAALPDLIRWTGKWAEYFGLIKLSPLQKLQQQIADTDDAISKLLAKQTSPNLLTSVGDKLNGGAFTKQISDEIDRLQAKRAELQHHAHGEIAPTSAGSRIEIADLKERIRKLEAIAAGVDL